MEVDAKASQKADAFSGGFPAHENAPSTTFCPLPSTLYFAADTEDLPDDPIGRSRSGGLSQV